MFQWCSSHGEISPVVVLTIMHFVLWSYVFTLLEWKNALKTCCQSDVGSVSTPRLYPTSYLGKYLIFPYIGSFHFIKVLFISIRRYSTVEEHYSFIYLNITINHKVKYETCEEGKGGGKVDELLQGREDCS